MTLACAACVADSTADLAVVGLVLKVSRTQRRMTNHQSNCYLYAILSAADDDVSKLAALDGSRFTRLELAAITHLGWTGCWTSRF